MNLKILALPQTGETVVTPHCVNKSFRSSQLLQPSAAPSYSDVINGVHVNKFSEILYYRSATKPMLNIPFEVTCVTHFDSSALHIPLRTRTCTANGS